MNRFQFAFFACLAVCATAPAAFALSTQEGTATSGAYNMNLADPDEQAPAFLKSPEGQAASANANHFDSDGNAPPMIVNQGILRQTPGMPFSNPYNQLGSQR